MRLRTGGPEKKRGEQEQECIARIGDQEHESRSRKQGNKSKRAGEMRPRTGEQEQKSMNRSNN